MWKYEYIRDSTVGSFFSSIDSGGKVDLGHILKYCKSYVLEILIMYVMLSICKPLDKQYRRILPLYLILQ